MPTLDVRPDQPLIGVVVRQDGREIVRYFADESAVAAAMPRRSTELALAAIGSWGDLDFDQTLDALDRIRHASPPTPPVELDL